PRQQILAFFDIRKAMVDEHPVRGCLGIKASQEYVGKHADIAALGKNAAVEVERRFVAMCERAQFSKPAKLGKHINIFFQGALPRSQVFGASAPFVSAKAAVSSLLDQAAVADRPRRGRKAAS